MMENLPLSHLKRIITTKKNVPKAFNISAIFLDNLKKDYRIQDFCASLLTNTHGAIGHPFRTKTDFRLSLNAISSSIFSAKKNDQIIDRDHHHWIQLKIIQSKSKKFLTQSHNL